MKNILLLLGVLTAQAAAVPILSGGVSNVGGVLVPLGGGFFTETVTRVGLINPANNIAAVETSAGLPAGSLNTLPGSPFVRAGIAAATFTGGVLGDGIRFTAQANPFILNTGVTPNFAYFAALDDLTGANPTLFMPLSLTAVAQTFQFLLPAAGDYQISIGAVRTNQNPGVLGSYGTVVTFSNLTGFGTPELDPARSTVPLLFCSVLLLSMGRRRQPNC